MFKHIVLLGINKSGGCDVSLRHKRSGGLHINNIIYRGIPNIKTNLVLESILRKLTQHIF